MVNSTGDPALISIGTCPYDDTLQGTLLCRTQESAWILSIDWTTTAQEQFEFLWVGGVVVRILAFHAGGRGFDSHIPQS